MKHWADGTRHPIAEGRTLRSRPVKSALWVTEERDRADGTRAVVAIHRFTSSVEVDLAGATWPLDVIALLKLELFELMTFNVRDIAWPVRRRTTMIRKDAFYDHEGRLR